MLTTHPLFICLAIALTSFSSASAAIILNDVMSREDQKKTGVANLTPNQKLALEKWLNQTFTVKPIDTKDPTQAPLSLSLNIDGGRKLQLSDGSLWEVDPDDIGESATWILSFPITIAPSKDPDYPFQLTDPNSGAFVKARRVESNRPLA